MLEVLKPPAGHVVALSLDGRVNDEEMEIIVAQIDGALESNERINLLVDISKLRGLTPKALLVDFLYSISALGRMYRFMRMAAITDSPSLEKLIRLEDRIFSDVDIKSFSSEERDQAFGWVEAKIELPPVGLEISELPNEIGLRIEVGQEVTGYDVRRLSAKIRDWYEEHGPVNLLARVEKYPKSGPGLYYEKFHALDLIGLISKYAVLGPASLQPRIQALSAVVNVRLQLFPLEEEQRALAWLSDASPSVELLPSEHSSLVAIRMSGKITDKEIRGVYQHLLPTLNQDNGTDLLLEVPYHEGMTLRGLFETLKLGVKHLSEVTKGLRRMALITDSRWMSKALDLENLLLPGIEQRPFTFSQRPIAKAWLLEGRTESPMTAALPSSEPETRVP